MPEHERLEEGAAESEDMQTGAVPAPMGEMSPAAAGHLSSLLDVPLELEVQLGSARLPIRDLLELQAGAVVTLDRAATDAVDLYAGDRLIARGEVVSVDGELGVRITEILHTEGQA